MIKEIQVSLPPEIAFDDIRLLDFVIQKYQIDSLDEVFIQKLKRSIDARSKAIKVNLNLKIYINEAIIEVTSYQKPLKDVRKSEKVIIVGAGPAGLFAALRLIELGLKPIILERGKNVRDRRRDLATLNKEHIVDIDSNYCFGEGGAGTYSDGKLYTRSDKRGNIRRILDILVSHGASNEILIDAHPHIGTNKLPQLIESIRNTILENGGEIHFHEKVVDFEIKNGEIKSVITASGNIYDGIGVILATGHSARDIFYLLKEKEIFIEAKPFALGIRAEHAQQYIDSIQYHCDVRNSLLPPSSYSMVAQVKYNGIEKGVFSFCMCPGGIIAPCATAPEEIVVNGWSPSKRNNKWANSGIVVSVDQSDWKAFESAGALAALQFQSSIEKNAFNSVNKGQTAPAQLMKDFIDNIQSANLLDSSYQPGLQSVMMKKIFPKSIGEMLKDGLKIFGQKMKGYVSNESQIIGVESRTSSPVRITRNSDTTEHVSIKRLFPCGEGAGYAGGIMSAAMDGERCAENLASIYGKL